MLLRYDHPGVVLQRDEVRNVDIAVQEFSTLIYDEGLHKEPLMHRLPPPGKWEEVILDYAQSRFVCQALIFVGASNYSIAKGLSSEYKTEAVAITSHAKYLGGLALDIQETLTSSRKV